MNIPLLPLPSSPTYPGISHVLVVPPGVVPGYVLKLPELKLPWYPPAVFDSLERIECDDTPQLEIETNPIFLSKITETRLIFRTREIEKIPVGASFIVNSQAFGWLLLSSQNPLCKVSVASTNPSGDPLTYKIDFLTTFPPVSIDTKDLYNFT